MDLPFTTHQFLEVFARYNLAVWPAQLVLYALALVALALAIRAPRTAGRWVFLVLAVLWGWMGLVYHWGYFTAINPAAWLFGAAFVVQGAGFLWLATQGSVTFETRWNGARITGAAIILYALVIYPLLGALAGHGYPAGPSFGLPCPTTIFTFGLVMWVRPPFPRTVVVIPALWSVLGVSAATQLGIWEDYGLLVAGVVATGWTLAGHRRTRHCMAAPIVESPAP